MNKMQQLGAVVLATAASLAAQPQQARPGTTYSTVTQTRVEGANAAEYEKLLLSDLKKVAQARIDQGEIRSWSLLKVLLPAGEATDHTHVTIVQWKNRPVLDPSQDVIEKMYAKAGVDRAAYIKKRNALGSKLVRTEIWRGIESTGPVEAGDLIRLDLKHVRAGAGREYVDMERSLYKPTHEQRIRNGALKQWSLVGLVLPGGQEYPYNFATVEAFKDETQMFTPPQMSDTPWRLAHGPSKPQEPVIERMNAISKQLPRRLHRVLAVLHAPTT